jgi:hypothetical protein
MRDALITEHAGTRQGPVTRLYQYGSGGVRVLDAAQNLRRLYLFEPSSDTITERDPARQKKILRRFVFDRYGMLEETFGFGQRPRTFRYEAGASRIAVREGGDYGAVGKTFTFEDKGVVETVWGRHGETERVYSFDSGNGTITLRKGGWFGDVERTIVFEGIEAALFREPESFLQFIMFTEWSDKDRDEEVQARVTEIRSGKAAAGRSPYAYSGPRDTAAGLGDSGGRASARRGTPLRRDGPTVTAERAGSPDSGIDFIPDADAPAKTPPLGRGPSSRRSEGVPFEERWQRRDDAAMSFSRGKSAEIPLDERFESAHREREELSKGRSAEIPLDERFGNARGEKEPLSPGRSVEIPLEERFESARREREKLSRGKSAEIPYDERRGGNK